MLKHPAPPLPSKIQTLSIPVGEAGVDQTVSHMTDLIRAGSIWPPLRPLALRIISGCPERDFDCMAGKVMQFILMNTRFINDNFGVETLQSVPYMISQMQQGVMHGDCDDFTILTGALLKSLGFQVKIRVLKFLGNQNYSHVMLVALIRGEGWRELDGTMRAGETGGAVRVGQKDYPVIV